MSTDKISTAEFLHKLADAVAAGVPAPYSINHLGSSVDVGLQFDSNLTECIDQWAAHLGVDARATAIHDGGPTRAVSRRWQTYEAVATWHGWVVRAWTALDLDEQAER